MAPEATSLAMVSCGWLEGLALLSSRATPDLVRGPASMRLKRLNTQGDSTPDSS
jgi:hypothetical protein